MFHFATSQLSHLLMTYGYWAVFVFVAIESTGIPFPGETMLLLAAIYADTTHQLSIALVIAAAPVVRSWEITWGTGLGVKEAIGCSVAMVTTFALTSASAIPSAVSDFASFLAPRREIRVPVQLFW